MAVLKLWIRIHQYTAIDFQASSHPIGTHQFGIDYDLILRNVKELNILAGEGQHVIQHTLSGAKLKVKEPVRLTLYANGIFMFEGPFRPFSDPLTQLLDLVKPSACLLGPRLPAVGQCVQDLMDGYFPSELHERYPDGVPFSVTDMRDKIFRDRRQEKFFPGSGQPLVTPRSSEEPAILQSVKPSKDSFPEDPLPAGRHLEETSKPPGQHKQSVDQFLQKLPASVIKDGKIVDVRADLAETLKGKQEKTNVVVVETKLKQDISNRSTAADVQKPRASSNITTLRVKSETGNKTYILKMKYTDTIRDLRRQIDKQRSSSSSPLYEIKTSFPNQTYNNPEATLEECGLTPNATLHLLAKKK